MGITKPHEEVNQGGFLTFIKEKKTENEFMQSHCVWYGNNGT